MLRRIPSTSDGKPVDRLQESIRINKPFKSPSLAKTVERALPPRKRKRVSYQGADGDNDSDSDAGSKKKKKKSGRNGDYEEKEPADNTQHFPVFKPKPFDQHATRRFSIPIMTNKDGQVVPTVQTNLALGIRPAANIIPRPLHDPMEDHAIVLYDPTVDDRETDEERKEREKEEARIKAEKEAREKTAGMYNPHKSLRELLGSGKDKQKKKDKVPVVIDPRLCKVLRPHQVEGVKVRNGLPLLPLALLTPPQFLYRCTTGMVVENQYGCIMADAMGLGKTLQCIALLWTLIKQSPHAGRPSIEKCIIACPSSLVKNWANELGKYAMYAVVYYNTKPIIAVKWLGKDTIAALAIDGKGGKAELLEKVARWVAASGRNVTQPGQSTHLDSPVSVLTYQ